MKRYAAVVLMMLAMLVLVPTPGYAQEAGGGIKAGETSLSVSGSGSVYRKPDYVDVVLGVSVEGKTAGEAQSQATAVMERVVAAVKGLKLDKEDLKSGDIRLSPRYEGRNHSDERPPTIVGYSASMALRVRTADVKAPARVIDVGLGAGANRVDGVEFGIHEAIEAREEAIRLASKAAKRKLGVLAESLDLRVVRLVSASSSSEQRGSWGQMAQFRNAVERGDGGVGEGAVEPGLVEVTAEVALVAAGAGTAAGGK